MPLIAASGQGLSFCVCFLSTENIQADKKGGMEPMPPFWCLPYEEWLIVHVIIRLRRFPVSDAWGGRIETFHCQGMSTNCKENRRRRLWAQQNIF
jgi:hypothetical protein